MSMREPSNMTHVALIGILCLSVSACSASIAPDDKDGHDGQVGAQIEHEADGSITHTDVDATDEAAWIYLDLDTGEQLEEGDVGWELGFQRYHIKMNGGVSGDEGVEAVVLEGVEFETQSDTPSEGWEVDAPDGDDDDSTPDYVLGTWCAYDVMTHILSPLDEIYVVRSTEGNAYKVVITDYYNDAGTSGHMSFSWAQL